MPNTTDQTTAAEQWLNTIDPTATPARDGRHLRAIGQALGALEADEARLQEAINAASSAGDSWAAIGAVLGTSRQAAHRKFAVATVHLTGGPRDGEDVPVPNRDLDQHEGFVLHISADPNDPASPRQAWYQAVLNEASGWLGTFIEDPPGRRTS